MEPKIEIQLPQVRLQLAELTALRNMIHPPDVECFIDHKVRDRLLLLGLAEYKVFPPCPKKLKAARETRQQIIQWVRERLTIDRIGEVAEGRYGRRAGFPEGPYEYPKEEKRLVATQAGRDLLAGVLTRVPLPKPDRKKGIPACA